MWAANCNKSRWPWVTLNVNSLLCRPCDAFCDQTAEATRITLMTTVNWRSRSFMIISFCCNWKPIYDLLLIINCHLSSISHHFRDTASWSQKTFHPSLGPLSSPFEFCNDSWHAKSWGIGGYILVKNCTILASAVSSHNTRIADDRQTTLDTSYGKAELARWSRERVEME